MSRRYSTLVLILGLALVAAAIAIAAAGEGARSADGAITNASSTHGHHQHGDIAGHLPASSANVELVSKLRLKNVVPDKIADVGVHNGHAYLAAWGGAQCKYNGVHVVDIRDVDAPKEVAFIQAKEGSAPGEGIQAIPISTPSFTGDVLVSNNEKCKDKTGFGGLNIYDVSRPSSPTVLAEGFGDETVKGQGKKDANDIHSVFAWDAGSKAYAVIVDNEEGPDVDIVDISDPKKPSVIAEYDLDERFPQISDDGPANLVEVFHHDMVVKQIGDRFLMLVSYWDGGYVVLDVTDPKNATYVADSDFADIDPQLFEQAGLTEAPEGNAHESEFTSDNRYIVAADEDFSATGLRGSTNDGGSFLASTGSATPDLHIGDTISGRTRYVGRACPGDVAVPSPAGATFAVVSRGLCTFTEKIAATELAGYYATIVVNREGFDGCGPFGMTVDGSKPAFSVERSVGFDLFDVDGYDNAACLAGTTELIPGVGVGQEGDEVTLESFFDGWGYVHLYRNAPGKLQELDTFAIPEAMDPAFAEGFGDLSVHEAAASPTVANRIYFSYYSGGVRVLEIQDDKLVEVGHLIDQGGSNFWGVQVFSQGGKEYFAASDMAFGLYIFEYTG
ncbi:MAG TPA: hypothetical protein VJM06_07025 [Gaiellaceae bacterium]|nr:hypothetical protein [Gaiellaceae bacterium]